MKLLICAFLCIASILPIYGQNKFSLDVTMKGLNATKGNFVIFDPYMSEGLSVSQVKVDANHYIIEDTCSYAKMTSMVFDDKRTMKLLGDYGFIPCKSSLIWLIIEPGKSIKVKGNTSEWQSISIKDGGENEKLSKINLKTFPIYNEWGNLQVKLAMDSQLSEEEKVLLNKRADSLFKVAVNIQKNLIKQDPSSVGALWYLDDMYVSKLITAEEIIDILHNIDKKYLNHPYYLTLMAKISSESNAVVGSKAPSICTTNTLDGSLFDLQTFKGKYVVLDFWGTWCGPCMAGMPKMKDMLNKYRDKLEILGIATETNLDNWRKVIDKEGLNWNHIYNGVRDLNYAIKYNITGYPTKILVSPDGIILLRVVNETDEFYDEVDKIIQAN